MTQRYLYPDHLSGHISDLEQAVLSCLREEPGMTNAELIVKTGKSQRTITRVLALAQRKGFDQPYRLQ